MENTVILGTNHGTGDILEAQSPTEKVLAI
jgi:hypothetical protein